MASAIMSVLIGLSLTRTSEQFSGSCDFEKDYSKCGYIQDGRDDFDWIQRKSGDSRAEYAGLPEGAFMFVTSDARTGGKAARLITPSLRENDTHCIDFDYTLWSDRRGRLGPGVLAIFALVDRQLLGGPVWRTTIGPTHGWAKAEIAVSTFWPSGYQIIFEAAVEGAGEGYIAIKNVQVLSYPCNKSPHFLRLGNVEVNAGQNASFQCIATGRNILGSKLTLQRSNGDIIPVENIKIMSRRRFAASFSLVDTRKSDIDGYRCVTRSSSGAGVSNFAKLIVRESPVPVAPPQLLGVGATYLWIALNANSIVGDGPIVLKEVEYRMPAGSWAEIHPVDTATYKLWQLDPDSEYEIRVRLTRPGEGGLGQPGPMLLARTKCAEPTRAPAFLEVFNVQPRQISIEWEPLAYNITRCFSHNITVYYRYKQSGNRNHEPVEVSLNEAWSRDGEETPAHTLRDLPPFTNVTVYLLLSNTMGQRQSDEVVAQTDEDVPGPVPLHSLKAQTWEDKMQLQWSEPHHCNGLITLYEVSYQGQRSFDENFDVAGDSGTVYKRGSERQHEFVGLHPGTLYAFTLGARTSRGIGPRVTVHFSTNISAPSMPHYDVEHPLEETDTTLTVLLKPAAARGAPIRAYQLVVVELPQDARHRRSPEPPACFSNPKGFDSSQGDDKPRHYIAAELPPSMLSSPRSFIIGDNETYGGFWNAPLDPQKNYAVYVQAMSSAGGETKIDCVRVATKGFAESTLSTEPADPQSRAKHTPRVVGIVAGTLLLVVILLALALFLKRRRSIHSYSHYLKLAKKRNDASAGGRQEMALMVNAVNKRYADHNSILPEEPFSFLNPHNVSGLYEGISCPNEVSSLLTACPQQLPMPARTPYPLSHGLVREPRGVDSPYHTGQLHPAVRVADLLQHIDQMKNGEGYGFKEEYESFFEGQLASWSVAKREENRSKNRYGNIIAYDHSRAVLETVNGDPNSDYINASYMDGYHRAKQYIATQGPLPETICDFWRMVWQEQTASIIMVTNLVEVGRVKCCRYWPDDREVYGPIKVTLVETEMLAEYIIRTFNLERVGSQEVREVRQFHFTSWPDHGVPYHATGLLAFVRRVKTSNPFGAGPMVVHCSAGAGRTGCFIVIDIMLDMAEKEGVVDIYNSVQELRSRRVNMVQTEEQYMFVHDAMLEACLCGDTVIPAQDFATVYYDLLRVEPQSNSNHVKDEFQTLNMVTPPLRAEDCSIALLPRNHDKNRFRDVLPADRCLPFLIAMDGDSSNYINATLLDSYSQPSAFIATQHPLPTTIKDFWRLVFDYHCTAIVMLNHLDHTQLCPQYWPEDGVLRHGPIQVEFAGCFIKGDVTNRTFRVCNVTRPQDGYRTVQHFQYSGWAPRKDVPPSDVSFLQLAAAVDKWQEEYSGDGRVLIHCLNGSARTGVFCAVTNTCEMIRRQSIVDVFYSVKTLRNNKPNMVDTLSQYQFCYDIALEYVDSA